VCGSVSAIGLQQPERDQWPHLRERLREPGHLMALMRGVLGDVEVAAVVAVTPEGAVKTRAILTTAPEIAAELELCTSPPVDATAGATDLQWAKIGGDDVQVLMGAGPQGLRRPLAILATPWIEQHLLLYARTLWHRRPRVSIPGASPPSLR
jgi:hypothetical protein